MAMRATFAFLLLLVLLPSGVAWGETIIPQIVPESCAAGICGLCDFIQLVQNILKAAIVISVFVATVLFAYAGWQYMTAQGKPDKIKAAHQIFWNVLVGIVIILAAWLIVETLIKMLTNLPGDLNLSC